MQYVITPMPGGKWRASLHLPSGDGSLSAVAHGINKAEATYKAAKIAKAHGQAPNKSQAISILAKGAAQVSPAVKDILKSQGLEAAKAVVSTLPGGGAVMAALNLASKYGPAKRLFGRLLS